MSDTELIKDLFEGVIDDNALAKLSKEELDAINKFLKNEQILNHEDCEVKLIKDDAEEQFLLFCFDCESILDSQWIDETIVKVMN